MNTLLENDLERLARTLVDRFGVEVVCKGDNAYTDGRRIVLPSMPDPLDEGLERMMVGYLDHEVAHVAFSDFQVAAEFEKRHPGRLGMLNVVEDALIERKAMARWPGVRRNLDRLFAQVRDRVLRLIPQRSPFDRFCTAIYLRLSHHRDMLGLEAELQGYEDLLDQFPSVQTTQDSADLSERLLKRWEQRQRETPSPKREQRSQSPDEAGGDSRDDSQGGSGTGQNQPLQSNEDADGESQGGAGSGQGDSPSQLDSSSDSGSGKADRSSSDDASTGGDPASSKQPSEDPSQAGNAMSDGHVGGTPGSLISQALDDAIREQMASIDFKRTYRPYTREHDRIVAIESAGAEEVQNLLQADRDGVRRLRRGLTNALRSREKRWWQDGQLRGTLSPRQLHRLCLDRCRIDVFRKRAVVQGKSTAIAILLDASGSMSQRKMDVARRALRVLLEALADLRVPTEALTFTTGNEVDLNELMAKAGGNMHQMRERYGRLSNLEIGIVQRFGEPVAQAWQRLPGIRGTGLTPLGEAMQVAASRLAVRTEERRILLVLSDGKAGCEGGSDVAEAHAIEMARQIQRSGIEVIGVGILDDHIAGVVDAALVVQDLVELPAQLCKLLSQTLMKGVHRVG